RHCPALRRRCQPRHCREQAGMRDPKDALIAPPRAQRSSTALATGLLVLSLGQAPLVGWAQAPPLPVVVASIAREAVNTPQEFLAEVEAIEAVDIQARVQGVLRQVVFEPGQHVEEAQLLFEIAPEQYEAAVAAAQAGVAQAEAA